jgi:hypothetical protein
MSDRPWGDLTDSDDEDWGVTDSDSESDSDWLPDCKCHSRAFHEAEDRAALYMQLKSMRAQVDELIKAQEVREASVSESSTVGWQRVKKGGRLTRVQNPSTPVSLITPNPFGVLAEIDLNLSPTQ